MSLDYEKIMELRENLLNDFRRQEDSLKEGGDSIASKKISCRRRYLEKLKKTKIMED